MEPRTHVRILVLGLAFVLSGCENEDEEFAGVYVGDGVDSQSASNRKEFTLRVVSTGSTVTGTYQINAVILDTSGSVSGTLAGSDLALLLTPSPGVNDCPYRISGTWQGDRITGTYVAINCPVRSDGSLNLEKQ